MTNSYNDGSHDPETGAYIPPSERVSADQFTITEEETEPVSVGTSADNAYNPDLDPRIHPELATGVGVSDTVGYNYTGEETFTVGIDTSANVIITEDINIDSTYSVDTTNLVDPYADAVDFSVAGMSTASYNPTASHEHQHEIKETLDRVLDQQVHLQHHVHELMIKVDEISQKVEHLLEHAHQPLTGTVQIDCPTKVGAGYTV